MSTQVLRRGKILVNKYIDSIPNISFRMAEVRQVFDCNTKRQEMPKDYCTMATIA